MDAPTRPAVIVQHPLQLLPQEECATLDSTVFRELQSSLKLASSDNLDLHLIRRAIVRALDVPWPNLGDLFRLVLLLNKRVLANVRNLGSSREVDEEHDPDCLWNEEADFKGCTVLLCHALTSLEVHVRHLQSTRHFVVLLEEGTEVADYRNCMLLLQTTCVICGSQNNKKSAREDAKHLTEACIAVLKVLCQLHQALATGQLLDAPSDSKDLNRLISLSALKGTILVSGHLNCYIKSVPHNALDYLYSILRGSLLRCEGPDAQELLHILWSSCKKKQLGLAAAQVLAHSIDALYKSDMVVSISLVMMVLHDLQQVLARSDPACQDAADSIEVCTNVLLLVAAAQDCGALQPCLH